ncbi:Predicted membrane protein [Lysobacter sp. yr284]|uniref:DUF2306 domain-containing protein n=1 Tax=Lysobacter sp. yr284 TaxID=1761791 RepID=UPI00089DA25F|nr:DUF2306 domain-containing protein [Lysobacter sp. yr284]SDZ07179.1 Predicted membrane protein [Lysobacter sp. yr284]
MSTPHLINIALHVAAGTLAMAIGFYQLANAKGSQAHRRWGRRFCYAGFAVCASAAAGLALFRFLPNFAVLTVLVLYQLLGGWRSARTRERGPQAADAALTVAAIAAGAWLTPVVLAAGANVLVYSSLGALASVIAYDAARWRFPRRWFARLWRYDHSYKLIAALFGMVSALVGNVVRFGQPWSQLLPLALGFATVGFVFVRLYRQDAARPRG